MLNLRVLDEFSRKFAECLFTKLPQFEQLAVAVRDENDKETGAFETSIPQPGGDRNLRISTQDEEITIGLEMWHEHVGPLPGLSDAEEYEEAIATINQILAERVVVRVSYRDGNWVYSTLVDLAEAFDPSESGVTTEVYSWLGTYDRTTAVERQLEP